MRQQQQRRGKTSTLDLGINGGSDGNKAAMAGL